MQLPEAKGPEVYAILREAVLAKQPVAAIYEGRQRFMCPHILGWNDARQPQVVSYQYGGDSSTGLDKKGRRATGVAWRWRCSAP